MNIDAILNERGETQQQLTEQRISYLAIFKITREGGNEQNYYSKMQCYSKCCYSSHVCSNNLAQTTRRMKWHQSRHPQRFQAWMSAPSRR